MIQATLFNDPACPWGYSAAPALRVLEWRYPDVEWRLVVIGLTEHADQYAERGYTPGMMAAGSLLFRDRYGMPFASQVKARVSGTGRACRAIVAARLADPGSEFLVMRTLQFTHFNTPLLLDEDADLEAALRTVPGLDAAGIVAALDSPEVSDAYAADRAEARTAAGSPTEFQGKSAATDGPVRYTAPSIRFTHGDRMLEAGGFQPVEAYDVLIANLDTRERRVAPPADAATAFERFPNGLTTQEFAAVLAEGNTPPDRAGAERILLRLTEEGVIHAQPLGDDALWLPGPRVDELPLPALAGHSSTMVG